MKITMADDYAVRSILYLAMNLERSPIAISEISKEQNIPKSFLYKIIQKLINKGYVVSHKGSIGGYTLSVDPKDISLKDVIEASEGPIYLNRCLVKKGVCDRDHFCSVHTVWCDVQESLVKILDGYSIEQLAREQKNILAKK